VQKWESFEQKERLNGREKEAAASTEGGEKETAGSTDQAVEQAKHKL